MTEGFIGHRRTILSLVAGAAALMLALSITEPLGPGLDPDAMAYLYATNSLVHHGVLLDTRDDWVPADSARALTRWPPGYPVAIAVPVALGMPPVQGARLVMALSAFATLALLVWLVAGAAGLAPAAVMAFVLLVTPGMAHVHLSVLSEPLFFLMLALTLAFMARPRGSRFAPLAEGSTAAAASMVRYAGLSAIGAVALWELLRAGTWRERIERAALAAAPGFLVNAWWWTRAGRIGGRYAVRDFSIYGQVGSTIREGFGTLADWLAPGVPAPWAALVTAAVILAVAATAVLGARRSALGNGGSAGRWPLADGLIGAAALLTLCYLGLVVAARMVADPNIPLDLRLTAPAMLLLTVIGAVLVGNWWRTSKRGWREFAVVAVVLWCAGSARQTHEMVNYALRTGSDYADICWQGSPVVAWVKEHGTGHPLVSNASPALFFQAGRLAREMPLALTPAEARAFTDTLAARDAYVVLFDTSCAETIDQVGPLVSSLGLVSVAQLRTGGVWRAVAPPAPPAAPR
jgi:hypothetical protein